MALTTVVSVCTRIVGVVTGSAESNLAFIRSHIVCLRLFEETYIIYRNIIAILEKSMWYQATLITFGDDTTVSTVLGSITCACRL